MSAVTFWAMFAVSAVLGIVAVALTGPMAVPFPMALALVLGYLRGKALVGRGAEIGIEVDATPQRGGTT